MEKNRLPLSGIKVIELCLARAGPTAIRHLADWGADVIKVEAPEASAEDVTGKRDDFDFQNLHRNKRTIRLDLKSAEGLAAFMKLVKESDVLIENMRATVKYRLKVSWEDLHKVNPRLVYGSLSGFGQTGPYSTRGGVDQIAQGMSGLMSVTGLPGQGPVRVGIAVGDMTAGNLLAMGIMMSLFERERTGEGRWVHTSLLESLIFMLDFQATRWLIKKEVPGQAGNHHPTGIPTGVYPSKDGFFNLAGSSTRLWMRSCDVLGKPEWKDKVDWSTQEGRHKDRKNINEAIEAITVTKPTDFWMQAFEDAGIPCGPIYTIDQTFNDPQVKHLGMASPVIHPRLGQLDLVASPLNFTGVEKKIRSATPEGGQHTDEIMSELGYGADDITRLRKEGVIL
jgi:crotonobetainyl-CoA:carnitine CoA-transferase CaiB-like acyl-CoA transferase